MSSMESRVCIAGGAWVSIVTIYVSDNFPPTGDADLGEKSSPQTYVGVSPSLRRSTSLTSSAVKTSWHHGGSSVPALEMIV